MSDALKTALELAPGIGALAWAVFNFITKSSTATTQFDRGQILNLQKQIDMLNAKLDEQQRTYDARLAVKDGIIEKKEEQIQVLQKQVFDLTTEVAALRHSVRDIQQTTGVKKDLLDMSQA